MKGYKRVVVAVTGTVFGMVTTTGFAQSSVQLYGVVDAFAGSVKTSGTSQSTAAINSSGLTTSYWGIGGKENLGGDLKAEFALESFFRTDTGQGGRFGGSEDTMFKRNAYVGLSSHYGTIKLGRNATPFFISMIVTNPLADSEVFSPIFLHMYTTPPGAPVGSSVAGDTGWSNSVLYQSPSFGGFRFNAIYSTGEVAGHTGQQSYGANATYFDERIGATIAVQRVGQSDLLDNGTRYQTGYLAGLSYDLTFVKVFGQFLQVDNELVNAPMARTRSAQLGASVPIGAGSLMASWVRTWRGDAATEPSARRDTATVAYDYPFSKRTDVYAAYRYDKATGFASASTFGLGLRHRF